MLNSKKQMYVYINSPGGSVFSLSAMLDFMKGMKSQQEFICISRFAASAAFIFFQHCDQRLLLPRGILMSHNMAASLSGELPKIKSQLDSLLRIAKRLDTYLAARLGITYNKYKRLIKNELWLDRVSAKKLNAIDGLVHVNCSPELKKQAVVKELVKCSSQVCKRFKYSVSACPLINKILKTKGMQE
jgi:ATP-dependent Clp protease protease subunit